MSNQTAAGAVDLVAQVTLYSAAYGMLNLQDGEFAGYASTEMTKAPPALRLGDWVRVKGTAVPGRFAPLIRVESMEWQKWSALPKAPLIDAERLAGTSGENLWGRVKARLSRMADISKAGAEPMMLMTLVSEAGLRFTGLCLGVRPDEVRQLAGADVEVTGVIGNETNGYGQREGPMLMVNQIDLVQVLRPGVVDWKAPKTSIDNILTYRSPYRVGDRIRAEGIVTYKKEESHSFYLTDRTGGTLVWLALPAAIEPGMAIEVTGVIERDGSYYGIGEAHYREAPKQTLEPLKIRWTDFYSYGGRLIETTLRYRSMERRGKTMLLVADRVDDPGHDSAAVEWNLSPAWDEVRFTPGDLLRVRGVAEFRAEVKYPLTILVRTPADLSVEVPAPWWRRTRWDVVAAVTMALLVLSLVVLWISRRQVGMVMAERSRIARELHDTLLQGFSGVILQLEAVAQQHLEASGKGRRELTAILNRMERYLGDARDSIAALRRSPASAVALADQLRILAEQQLQGSGLAYEFRVEGNPRNLPRHFEVQIYRIATEAIANTLRHAKARQLRMILHYQPASVSLMVVDDGCGFDPGSVVLGERHFGLQGMRERTAELKGEMHLDSAVGKGCLLRVTLPG